MAARSEDTVAKKRRASGSEKRKNPRVTTLRLSDKQHAELVRNAEALGISVSGYIRKRCCTAQEIKTRKVVPVEVLELMRLRGQLGRLGNNLNQIVRRENFNDLVFAEDYADALTGLRETIGQCHALLRDAHRRMAG